MVEVICKWSNIFDEFRYYVYLDNDFIDSFRWKWKAIIVAKRMFKNNKQKDKIILKLE
jgi:hypothetical protein